MTRFKKSLSRLLFAAVVISSLLHGQQNNAPASTLPTGNDAIDQYNQQYLLLTRALMSPQSVADAFGRRIAKRYIAMQITVANRNRDYQWLITDGAINLARLMEYMQNDPNCAPHIKSLQANLYRVNAPTPDLNPLIPPQQNRNAPPGPNGNPTVTGVDLTVLRGVAEKGQSLDPRNLTFRLLQASGTIAAGLVGVTDFGHSFAPGVAAFNGPLLAAYQTAFPDHTVNQLNRLNDSAYAANTLVPKQQAKVLVVFVPMSILLTTAEQKDFYKDPNKVFSSPCTDLRLLDANVNGHYVTQLDLTPIITAVTIAPAEGAKFATDNFKVAGTITGRFLDGAALSLTGAPAGLTIALSGAATAERIDFELDSQKPLAPNTPITITLTKPGLPPVSYTLPVSYMASKPTLAATSPVSPASITQGDMQVLEITGTGFLPGATIQFSNTDGLTVGDVEYVSVSKLKVSVTAAAGAAVGARDLFIRTVGGDSGKATLTIAQKQ